MNTARPKVAEMPQQRPAAAMERYPRMTWGCSTRKELVDALWAEPNDNLVADHQGWSCVTPIFINQIVDRLGVRSHIALLEFDTSTREVGLNRVARWSAGLRENDDQRLVHA